ncbi:hypothetical protein COLO4_38141 [Corchorus olitorius]|uniref:Uncharacterized protein n=1 Tax=Corchorus olitorius TaxID=93759 RepID=A0A1R3FWQ1_9ROSI|nr:hypothetical protein COLO4_38141 [Corchorus olitorius]
MMNTMVTMLNSDSGGDGDYAGINIHPDEEEAAMADLEVTDSDGGRNKVNMMKSDVVVTNGESAKERHSFLDIVTQQKKEDKVEQLLKKKSVMEVTKILADRVQQRINIVNSNKHLVFLITFSY